MGSPGLNTIPDSFLIRQVLTFYSPKHCFHNFKKLSTILHKVRDLAAVKKSRRTNEHLLLQNFRKFSTAKFGYFEKTRSKDCLLFVVKS